MRLITLSLLMVGLSAIGNIVAAQTTTGQEYYVTIGVFAVHDNAIKYTARANKMGFNAHYAINAPRKLYYVYLLQTDDKRKAFAFDMKLRAESDFKDAWVFVGHLGEDASSSVPVAEVKPVVKEPVDVQTPVEKKDSVVTPPVAKVDSSTLVKQEPVKPVEKKKAKGKFFVFKFINEASGNEVRGEIHFQENNKATQYQAFKADEIIDLPPPRNAAGVYYVVTVAPGYRPMETNFNYKDPLPVSSGTGPDGEIIVPLSLTRAKRGDYIEFNNVTFFRNSVVMQPHSQAELDGLADLMKEHTGYKVRIHGHCNGTEQRDIITLGTSTKYFEADPTNQKKSASAKELTELRAEAVRRYLVTQGVSVERMLTKGDGGKMMVYPQTSVYANYNDRVEVEIIKH